MGEPEEEREADLETEESEGGEEEAFGNPSFGADVSQVLSQVFASACSLSLDGFQPPDTSTAFCQAHPELEAKAWSLGRELGRFARELVRRDYDWEFLAEQGGGGAGSSEDRPRRRWQPAVRRDFLPKAPPPGLRGANARAGPPGVPVPPAAAGPPFPPAALGTAGPLPGIPVFPPGAAAAAAPVPPKAAAQAVTPPAAAGPPPLPVVAPGQRFPDFGPFLTPPAAQIAGARYYSGFQPVSSQALFYGVWDRVRGSQPGGFRAKGADSEQEGREWLWDHRHFAAAVAPLRVIP